MEDIVKIEYEVQALYKEKRIPEALEIMEAHRDQSGYLNRLLCICYEKGEYTQKRPEEAMRLLVKAAELGDKVACNMLGYRYECGTVVPKDGKKAFGWYKRSAERGYKKAYLSLGDCYANGIGVEKDTVEAYKHYEKAVSSEGDTASLAMERLSENDGKVRLYLLAERYKQTAEESVEESVRFRENAGEDERFSYVCAAVCPKCGKVHEGLSAAFSQADIAFFCDKCLTVQFASLYDGSAVITGHKISKLTPEKLTKEKSTLSAQSIKADMARNRYKIASAEMKEEIERELVNGYLSSLRLGQIMDGWRMYQFFSEEADTAPDLRRMIQAATAIAELGNGRAMHTAGECYVRLGDEDSIRKGMKWFERSAKAGLKVLPEEGMKRAEEALQTVLAEEENIKNSAAAREEYDMMRARLDIERTRWDKTLLSVKGATLLTYEQAMACRFDLACGEDWFLIDDDPKISGLFGGKHFVDRNGKVSAGKVGVTFDNSVYRMRPALELRKSDELRVGTGFELFGYEWLVIDEEHALCGKCVDKSAGNDNETHVLSWKEMELRAVISWFEDLRKLMVER